MARTKARRRAIYLVRWNRHKGWWTCWSRRGKADAVHVSSGPRKYEVVEDARVDAERNQPSQLVIHGKNGRIQTEWTYGADPRRFKG